MQVQSVQLPIATCSIQLTLTPQEQDALLRCLDVAFLRQYSINDSCVLLNLRNKVLFLQPNIGDACRSSVHIPEVPGQEGN